MACRKFRAIFAPQTTAILLLLTIEKEDETKLSENVWTEKSIGKPIGSKSEKRYQRIHAHQST